DVSRITLSRIQLRSQTMRLDAIIERALEQVQSRIDARNQTLTITIPRDPIYLHVDPIRMDQILGNLLTNASKFTNRGGHIWVSGEIERHPVPHGVRPPKGAVENQRLVLRVKDDGMGVDKAALPHIFDLFMRATRSVEYGGLGIGLTLVRRLVELHGGVIEANS